MGDVRFQRERTVFRDPPAGNAFAYRDHIWHSISVHEILLQDETYGEDPWVLPSKYDEVIASVFFG
jgi:hypothetical protein